MKAWWWDKGLQFGDRPIPELILPDDVRIRVMIGGLCRTDVAVAKGTLPCIEPCVLGHEIAGVVESVGEDVRCLKVGDRVACHPRVDLDRLGVERDGGFAEFLVVPERALVRVPDGLDWRSAAFVEPVAACLAVKSAPLSGTIRVIGDGRIAALTSRVVKSLGHELVENVADVIVETGGTSASLSEAMASVNDGGLVILKSRPAKPILFDITEAVSRELRFHAVGWADFGAAFDWVVWNRVDDLLGEVWPLEALDDLLDASEERKVFLAPEPYACAG